MISPPNAHDLTIANLETWIRAHAPGLPPSDRDFAGADLVLAVFSKLGGTIVPDLGTLETKTIAIAWALYEFVTHRAELSIFEQLRSTLAPTARPLLRQLEAFELALDAAVTAHADLDTAGRPHANGGVQVVCGDSALRMLDLSSFAGPGYALAAEELKARVQALRGDIEGFIDDSFMLQSALNLRAWRSGGHRDFLYGIASLRLESAGFERHEIVQLLDDGSSAAGAGNRLTQRLKAIREWLGASHPREAAAESET